MVSGPVIAIPVTTTGGDGELTLAPGSVFVTGSSTVDISNSSSPVCRVPRFTMTAADTTSPGWLR